MDTIVSKSNEKVKFIKSLNDKKFRNKYKFAKIFCYLLEVLYFILKCVSQSKLIFVNVRSFLTS